MRPYFRDDLRWFQNNPERACRIRLAHEVEVEEWMRLYYKTTGTIVEPSIYPAYAVVLRLAANQHARQIFFCDADFSHVGDGKALAIFQHMAEKRRPIK